ncbi:hypothetical protein L596_008472 [Steinernema carpocapsae]|uniref:Uncharacterized protein n=1 Tax=Steinernema carpocapsae TaxID=34508 RepID=A0A4U5PCV5_STECR|nr:hypothetical protein L596_008472 [Steinernema carpocapsae]
MQAPPPSVAQETPQFAEQNRQRERQGKDDAHEAVLALALRGKLLEDLRRASREEEAEHTFVANGLK